MGGETGKWRLILATFDLLISDFAQIEINLVS